MTGLHARRRTVGRTGLCAGVSARPRLLNSDDLIGRKVRRDRLAGRLDARRVRLAVGYYHNERERSTEREWERERASIDNDEASQAQTTARPVYRLRWKKALSKRCAPKIFASPQTPFPGAHDRQNLISWRRSLTAPTDPVWWRSMHAISSYRGNRHRPPATNIHTQTGPITIHCAAS